MSLRLATLALLGLAGAAAAQLPPPASWTPDQAGEDYDHCLRDAAMGLSRSDTAPEGIYPAVKQSCAARRAALLADHADRGAALDEVDTRRSATLADGIRRVRERQRAASPESGGQKVGS